MEERAKDADDDEYGAEVDAMTPPPTSSSRPWVIASPSCEPAEVEEALRLLDPAERLKPGDDADWGRIEERLGKEPPELIVAFGGDGTIQRVVRLIGANSDVTLGILPAGTGNDFARALELPLNPAKVAQGLGEGVDRSVDLMEVSLDGGEPELVINAVTIGLSTVVHAALTDEMKERWGRFAYLRAGLAAAGDLAPFQVELKQEGAEVEEPAWNGRLLHVSIANGSTAGGGMVIAPGAEVDDGRIDVCAVAEAPWARIAAGIPEVLGGTEPEEGPWTLSACTEVEVVLDEERDVSVDGELLRASRIRSRILPGALRVRMPKAVEGPLARLFGDGSSEG